MENLAGRPGAEKGRPFRKMLLDFLIENPASVEVERGYLSRYREELRAAVSSSSAKIARGPARAPNGPRRGLTAPNAQASGSRVSTLAAELRADRRVLRRLCRLSHYLEHFDRITSVEAGTPCCVLLDHCPTTVDDDSDIEHGRT